MAGTDADAVVDYDANGYDYRSYWNGRDYESWAESHALRRLLRTRLPRSRWFADFGGGFGRNAAHYLERSQRGVLMDYSATNLRNAGQAHAGSVARGRLHLVRCDLNAVPFRDFAFDAAMVVRVLHHLGDVDHALAEMGRTVGGRWIVDVPIKHHALGVLRAARQGRVAEVSGPEPMLVGSAEPYWNFQLEAIRERLRRIGWRPLLGASVNNFRRWDRVLPAGVVPLVGPLVRAAEALTQVVGRGWWGPSQLVVAQRYDRVVLPDAPAWPGTRGGDLDHLEPELRDLACRMVCPVCVRALKWSPDEAYCDSCCVGYRRVDLFWDFVGTRARREIAPATPGRPCPLADRPNRGRWGRRPILG